MPAGRETAAYVAERFVLESFAGSGGMGRVYRALDTQTGQTVAVKLLQANANEQEAERFARETQLLSELRHPGIVSYLAHGETQAGEPYLAMEWLEGEDLAKRLSRGALALDEALVLLRRVAEALAVAHARGVVHRDLKPSNIFLRDGEVERAALLDFGIARRAVVSQVITGTGLLIGTPAYMAPEQARGEKLVTPAADIFSMGAVFFECLTGRPPFVADQVLAVLARILFDEPPRLRDLRPEMPASLEALLERMLAKEPTRRVGDAAALLDALDALDELHPSSAAARSSGAGEQQLLSVLMATLPPAPQPAHGPPVTTIMGEGIIGLHRGLAEQGAKLEVLADGSLVATLEHMRGAATDQAARAARCALLIKAHWPGATIALSTGRGLLHGRAADGEVFERAAALLRRGPESSPDSEQILLDEVSRGLLEVRFVVQRSESGCYTLTGEELALDETRPLLGKPTPCVGRDLELGMLETALGGCIEETEACAVVVTAPPGAGKSRLRHEFIRRIEARGDDILVLIGRGDPLSAGSSYGPLGQALRRLCGILDGESIEIKRAKLARRVGEGIAAKERERVVAFMGELCGVPFPDADNVKLRAARQDPLVMRDQITQVVLDFLRAECARRAVLLVLEDLHWSDALTVKLCEAALRELADRPLLILALARPEVDDLFPNLWGSRAQRMPLRPLGKKAGERLVLQMLGDQTSPVTAARIVAQSEGNALFLEELIRAAAEGRGDEVPETVLAMLQSRIGRLDAGARRVLRAASVFGETCWRGGIRAVLDRSVVDQELESCLARLTHDEILEQRRESRFAGEKEYRFRHALMRDACYGLLVEADRRLAHGLAGAYLEQIGEPNPLVLAEHYHLGGALESAVRCYVRGAKDLFDRHDLSGALRCIEAGMACGASGMERGLLSALHASSAFWMDDPERACAVGGPIVSELPAGSYPWCRLVGALIPANAGLGRQAAVAELGRLLLGADPADDARAAYVEAVANLSNISSWFGLRGDARVFLDRIDAVSSQVWATDAVVRGWACCAHCFYDLLFGDRQWEARRWADEGTEALRQVGDQRNQVAPEVVAGLARAILGDEDGADLLLRDSVARAQRVGQPFPISYAKMHRTLALAESSSIERRAEAAAVAREWVDSSDSSLLFQGISHTVLGKVALLGGDPGQALADAQKGSELLAMFPPYHLFALSTLSAVLLALGRAAEAKEVAAMGRKIADDIGGAGAGAVHLAFVEALYAAGEAGAAREALEYTLERLRVRLDAIPDAEARELFLTRVPASARVVALAKERLGIEVRGS